MIFQMKRKLTGQSKRLHNQTEVTPSSTNVNTTSSPLSKAVGGDKVNVKLRAG